MGTAQYSLDFDEIFVHYTFGIFLFCTLNVIEYIVLISGKKV